MRDMPRGAVRLDSHASICVSRQSDWEQAIPFMHRFRANNSAEFAATEIGYFPVFPIGEVIQRILLRDLYNSVEMSSAPTITSCNLIRYVLHF